MPFEIYQPIGAFDVSVGLAFGMRDWDGPTLIKTLGACYCEYYFDGYYKGQYDRLKKNVCCVYVATLRAFDVRLDSFISLYRPGAWLYAYRSQSS